VIPFFALWPALRAGGLLLIRPIRRDSPFQEHGITEKRTAPGVRDAFSGSFRKIRMWHTRWLFEWEQIAGSSGWGTFLPRKWLKPQSRYDRSTSQGRCRSSTSR